MPITADELAVLLDGPDLRVAADRRTINRRQANPNAPSVTKLELIQEALAQVDQPAIEADMDGRWEWRQWDMTSPINGVPAEQVLARLRARGDLPDGTAPYLLVERQDDGSEQVVILQPHRPHVGGKQPVTDVAVEAQTHRREVVAARVHARVAQEVAARLAAGGGV